MVSFRAWTSSKGPSSDSDVEATSSAVDTYQQDSILPGVGTLKYTVDQGGNEAAPTYQEASGAPVETKSSLGYAVGPVTIILLNISQMIGTGVYSTPATILKDVGSVGLSMIYWSLGLLTSAVQLVVYLEFASYFPSRSGSEVVYLEQAFPRPKYFFPVVFAIQYVITSFSSGNSIVLAQYLFATNGHTPTAWEQKGVAVAGYTVAVLLLVFNTKLSYRITNAIAFVKVLTLIFVAITGLVVLGGHTRVEDPKANFRNAFEGTTNQPYGITNALVKVIYAYTGYTNAFNVVNEIKNPVKAIKRNATYSLLVVTILYVLANIAYFAAVPKHDITKSGQTVAAQFFKNVFGESKSVKAFNILIAISAFGNLTTVLIGQSRLIRECGRQGVLPYPRFWASTRPFGTPLGPYFVKWLATIIMILAPPAGDAFNLVIDLQTYPSAFFSFIMSVGLYIVRHRRQKLGIGRSDFRAWDSAVVLNILVNLFLLVMPWYPPATGRDGGDVSFWYATYCVAGIGIIVGGALYYYLWVHLIPKLRHCQVRQEILQMPDGAKTHELVRVPNAEVEHWDATHDESGRVIIDTVNLHAGDGKGTAGASEKSADSPGLD